jgi:hypothetical protein
VPSGFINSEKQFEKYLGLRLLYFINLSKERIQRNGFMKNVLIILLFLLSNQLFSQIKILYKDSPPKIDGDISDWKSAFYFF